MNLDETTCKLWYKPQKGNIAGALVTATREGSLVQDVSPGMQKASLSHMGLICDTPPLATGDATVHSGQRVRAPAIVGVESVAHIACKRASASPEIVLGEPRSHG